MTIYHSMDTFPPGGCVAALGTFDGVHLGHAALIRRAVMEARALNVPSVALTFDRHPLSVIAPGRAPRLLTDAAERRRLFASLGLDAVIEQPFTPAFAHMAPEVYLTALAEAIHPRAIVVGYDHRFGRDGAGTADTLRAMAPALGCEAIVVPPVMVDGAPVSSSRIRALLGAGDAAEAERLAGHPLRG